MKQKGQEMLFIETDLKRNFLLSEEITQSSEKLPTFPAFPVKAVDYLVIALASSGLKEH